MVQPPTSPPADRFHFYAGVARNTVYLTAAIGAASAGLLACDVLLARTLSVDDYGLIVYMVGLISFLLYLSDLGLSRWLPTTLAGALARGDRKTAARACGSALVLEVAAGCLLAAGVVAVSYRMPEVIRTLQGWFGAGPRGPAGEIPPRIAQWMRVLALWLVILPIVRYFEGVYDGYQQMRFSFLSALFREPVRALVIAAVVAVTADMGAVVLAVGLAPVLILAVNLCLFGRFRRATPDCRLALEARSIAKVFYSTLYFFLPMVGLWVFPDLVRLVAGTFDSLATAGKLKICMSLTLLAFVPLGALARAFLPAFGSKVQDRTVLGASFLGSLKLAGLVNFAFFVLMASAGAYVARGVFGAEYPVAEMHGLMVLVALGSFYEGFRLLTEPVLQGTGHAPVAGYIEAVRLAVLLALGVLVVPRWPGEGIAVILCVVNLLAWALRFAAVQRFVVRVPWAAMTGLALMNTVMAVAALRGWTAVFWIVAAAAVVVQALTFTRADVAAVRSTLKILLRGLRSGRDDAGA